MLSLTDDRLKVKRTSGLSRNDFWKSIATQLGVADTSDRHAVIFVHGYKTSFSEAAIGAAQIGSDLSIKGAMAFFSWPSRGTYRGYLADEATIEASEDHIADFMIDFAQESGAESVHVIAHSMGNRGVLRAVNRIANKAQMKSGGRFAQIVLAAADVDVNVFKI